MLEYLDLTQLPLMEPSARHYVYRLCTHDRIYAIDENNHVLVQFLHTKKIVRTQRAVAVVYMMLRPDERMEYYSSYLCILAVDGLQYRHSIVWPQTSVWEPLTSPVDREVFLLSDVSSSTWI